MTLHSVSKNLRNKKTIQFFILLNCVFYLAVEPAVAQTNSNNQKNVSPFRKKIITEAQEKRIHNSGKRAFVGNLLGSFIGGFIGAGVTTATGYASGGLDDADKVLFGLYAGGIIGSTMGSAIALHSKENGRFKKILLHAFIPHVLFSGTGLILSQVTETPSDGVILVGMYLMGWIISPIEAARAYRSNNINENLRGGIIQDNRPAFQYEHNQNSFSMSVKLLTINW